MLIAMEKSREIVYKVTVVLVEDKCDIRDKNLLLYLQTVLITAGLGVKTSASKQQRMQVNNIFTVNFISCPLKANTCRLKNIACNLKTSQNHSINTWQIAEVSDSTKRHADNSGNHVDL